jgi:DNA-binding MarR family transcriptional regulator
LRRPSLDRLEIDIQPALVYPAGGGRAAGWPIPVEGALVETETIGKLPAAYSHPMAGHLGFLLRRVQLAVFNDFQTRTASFNLTPTDYSILTVLDAEPGMQQSRLAEIVGVKPANCVALITGLEKRRLLDRRVFAKKLVRGRALALCLTPDGKKLLKQINRRVDEHQMFLVQLLGSEAHKELRRILLLLLEQVDRGLFG